MSYSIGFYIIEKDTNKYVCIGHPNVNPSYNYAKVFKGVMQWDYKTSEYYSCDEVLNHIDFGLAELWNFGYKYIKMLPYQNVQIVTQMLMGIRKGIIELGYAIPVTSLYMKWD